MKLAALLRRLFVAGAMLSLQACANMVMSQPPVLTAQDSAAAPRLKPGFWNGAALCGFGMTGCGDGLMVSDETLELPSPKDESEGPYEGPMAYRLGGGDPLVMQIEVRADAEDRSGDVHLFAGVEPISHDAQGRVDAMRIWQVVCGPPPAADAARPDKGHGVVTEAPFAGVTMEGQACAPRGREGLFAAARASRLLPGVRPSVIRWVADKPPPRP